MRTPRFSLFGLAVAGVLVGALSARACEFCSAPQLTLSEQVDQADAVVLAKWVKAVKAKPRDKQDDEAAQFAKTTYQVVQVVKNAGGKVKKETEIVVPDYRPGKPGDLAMLLGSEGTTLEWGVPIEVTKASFNYIAKAPGPKEPMSKRLEFFLDYLEFPDDLVANDAYGEFASAPFAEIKKLKDKYPRERIRKWITDKDTAVTRLGLYGLMLGLCGNEDDAKLMADHITQPTQDFRLGIDGIMAGYLLLKGEDGPQAVGKSQAQARRQSALQRNLRRHASRALRVELRREHQERSAERVDADAVGPPGTRRPGHRRSRPAGKTGPSRTG